MRYERSQPAARLEGHDAARRFFAGCFGNTPKGSETLWVAHVDRNAQCLELSSHSGGPEQVQLPVRQIISDAARLGSAGVVLAHNHPSGDASPSEEDCRATRRLAAAAEALDLTVVDHLVFAGAECRSFRRMGLL